MAKTILSMLLPSMAFANTEINPELNNVKKIDTRSGYDSWLEKKKDLKQNHGFDFELGYNMLALTATDPLGESSTASGTLMFKGNLALSKSESGSKGGIGFQFSHRHAYTENAPNTWGLKDQGYSGFIHPLFSDDGFKVSELYWNQSMANDNVTVWAGLLHMVQFTDVYTFTSPWNSFNNIVYSTGNGAIGGLPEGALGVFARGFVSDHFYVSGAIMDAKGNPTDIGQGVEDFFDSGATFKMVEFGYLPSTKKNLFSDNFHVTLWQRDEVEVSPTYTQEAGTGMNISYTTIVDNQWLPFARAGVSDGGFSLYDMSVTAGFGYIPSGRNTDMLGVAFNVANVMESTYSNALGVSPDMDTQYGSEIFYRVKVAPWLELIPSVQALNYTAFNVGNDNDLPALIKDKCNIVFGLKARFVF